MKIKNTRETPHLLVTLNNFIDTHLWYTFTCIKCGKVELKRDVSIKSMIKNNNDLLCGPCLRKMGTLKNHGSETWNNPEKSKQTCLEKYGVDSVWKAKEIKEKIKKTLESNGGFTFQRPDLIEKIKDTKLKKYGSETYNNSNKRTQTNLKKYGGVAPACSEEVKEKQRQTLKQKYGNNLPGPMACHNKFLQYRISQIPDLDFENLEDFRGKWDNGPIYYKFKCKICNSEFTDSFHDGLPTCRKCHPIQFRQQENQLFDFIKSFYTGNIIIHDRKILNGKELDVYLPDLKLAFEYNGSYWHSFNSKTSISFKEFLKLTEFKRLECQKQGIRLINIDECDWLNKPEVIKRFIKNVILPRKRINARDCDFKIVDTVTAKDFCEYYHFNGFRGGQEKYGLYLKDELLCVAIFSPHKKYEWECIRLCFKTGIDIIGGWAKIQKHFGRKFLHYVNLKYFEGENKTGCGYRFLVGKERKILHRNALQSKNGGLQRYCKDIDPYLSDFQNCLKNNFLCIVDQGNDIRIYNENLLI